MKKYCKAYPLGKLRQFGDWTERHTLPTVERTDETIVYLWDDFTVVENPILNEGDLFDAVTPAWQQFCQQTLQFTIPEDLHQMQKK